MDVIEITLQIEAETNEIHVSAENVKVNTKNVVYIDKTGKITMLDMDEAAAVQERFGDNCNSEMIGKSDYILVYDASKIVTIDGHGYLACEALIMKSGDGLESLGPSEVRVALGEFKSRLVEINFGNIAVPAYEIQ